MTPEEAFLADICEHPDDDAPRLIFADWLDDHGGAAGVARAEFIRVQCERAHLPLNDPRQGELQARERRLLVANYTDWAGGYREIVDGKAQPRFRRGFIDKLEGWEPEAFVEKAPALCPAHPIRYLSIVPRSTWDDGWGPALAACPHLGRLDALRLRGQLPDLLKVCRSPHLGRLRTLALHNHAGQPVLPSLLGARGRPMPDALAALRYLILSDNMLDEAGLAVLADSPLAGTLRGLSLSRYQGLTTSELRRLTGSPLWPRLEELEVNVAARAHNEAGPVLAAGLPRSQLRRLTVTGEGRGQAYNRALVEMVAGASGWGRLEALSFGYSSMGSATFRALLACPHLAGLTWLDLSDAHLVGGDAQALASCPRLANLTVLKLGGNILNDMGIRRLAESPYLNRLVYLDLHGTGISTDGAVCLARSPNLSNLRILNLCCDGIGSGIGDAGLQALAESPHLANLTTLLLSAAPDVTERGIEALVGSPHFGRLTYLDVIPNPTSERAVRPLKQAYHIAWVGVTQPLHPYWERMDASQGPLRSVRGVDVDWEEPFFSWDD
jgi:uncharacterized protein (TIGR02996 family)